MKPLLHSRLHILPLIVALHGHASAAEVIKASNTTALNSASSFTTAPLYDGSDTAVWDSTVTAANTVGLGGNLSFAGIRIANPTGLVTLSAGSTLTLGSGGIDMSAATQNLTLSASNTSGASQAWNIASGRTLTINTTGSTTTFNTGTITTLTGAGTVEFANSRVLAGDGTLEVNGAMLFNNLQGGTQTRTGPTTLTSGSIKIQTSVNLFGSGALNLNGGRIGSGNTTRRTISNTANVGGDFEVGGTGLSTGAIQLSGTVDFGSASRQITATSILELTGTVTNAPTLVKLGTGSLALGVIDMSSTALNLSAGKLLLGGNGTSAIGSLSGASGTSIDSNYNLVSDGLRPLSVNQTTDGTYAGVISSAGGAARAISLLKRGTAKLTLSGANTYAGGTTLSQGTLAAITSNDALSTSGTVTINDTNTGSNNTALLLGNITMARAITVANQGSGTTTLGANGSAALPTFSGAITLAKDVTLDGTGNTDRLTFTGGIGGTGNVTIAGGTNRVVFATTANTYTGTTTVNANSILQLSTGSASTASFIPDTSVVTLNSGSFLKLAKGANSETIGGLAGSGTLRGHEGVANIASTLVIDGGASQTFSGVLQNGGASGATLSLTKSGAGTQTLSGVNTYSGATNINGGTLALSGSGSIANTSTITVASGATLDVSAATFTLGTNQVLAGAGTVTGTVNQGVTGGTITASGGNLSIGSLVYSGDGIINVTPGSAIVNVTATDGLSISASNVTLNLQGGALSAGQYPVIDYSGTVQGSGIGSLLVGSNPGGAFTYTLVDNPANSSVDLVVASLADVWSGAFSNEWSTASIGGSKNWTLNSVAADYADGHDVQFTDAATGTTTVDISAGDVTPASVAFNHSSKNYTLQGSAAIAGSTGLSKAGSGTLTLNNVNKFTGAATITGGTVVVSSVANGGVDSPLGAGTDISLGAATLSYAGASASMDRLLSLTAPGTLEVLSSGAVLALSGPVSGGNPLTKTGAGVLEIAGANGSFSGATQINGGTFRIVDGGTWGTGAITDNATLEINQSTALTLANAISGSGTLVKNGSGTLTLGSASTFTGGTTITAGQLNIGSGVNNTASAGTGSIDIASGATLGLAWSSGVVVFPNNLTGSGTVIRGGTSEVALTGNNSFSGTYQISTNTLAFRTLSSASGQPRVVIASGANLALGNDFAGQTCTISELSGAGGVNPQFDGAAGIKTLAVNQATTTTFSGVMRDATSGSRFLALSKSGAGTLTLSGTNTYTGATTINGGTLALGASNVLANTTAVSIGAGTLEIGAAFSDTVGTLDPTGAATIHLGAGSSLAFAASNTLDWTGGTMNITGTFAPGSSIRFGTTSGGLTSTQLALISVNGTGAGTYTLDASGYLIQAGFSAWANTNAPNQTLDQDHDGDGVSNGVEYFMGLSGNGFTANPVPNASNVVSWPKGTTYNGIYGTDYAIQISTDLGVTDPWTNVPESNLTIDLDSVDYDLDTAPTGPKKFVRLKVTGP